MDRTVKGKISTASLESFFNVKFKPAPSFDVMLILPSKYIIFTDRKKEQKKVFTIVFLLIFYCWFEFFISRWLQRV